MAAFNNTASAAAPGLGWLDEIPVLGKEFGSLAGDFAVPATAKGREVRSEILVRMRSGGYVLENVDCYCGAGSDVVLATVERYRLPHRSVLCTACGLIRTSPRLNADAYAHFYKHYYRALYERPMHSAQAMFSIQAENGRRRFEFIRAHAPKMGRVIEIGCGAGWNLLPLAQSGVQVVGYDHNDEYLQAGRDRNLDLRRGSLQDAIAAGERYDLVILSHVVEHLLDPVMEMKLAAALLNPDGRLFVEVPSFFRATNNLLKYFQNAHTYSFVPETLNAAMTAAGYRQVAATTLIESLWQFTGECSTWRRNVDLGDRVLAHGRKYARPSTMRQVTLALKIGVARLLREKGVRV